MPTHSLTAPAPAGFERARRLLWFGLLPLAARLVPLVALLAEPSAPAPSRTSNDFDYASSYCGGPPGNAMVANADGRPNTVVTQVSSEAIGSGKRITTLLVRFPPRSLTPKHVHGGVVNAYILEGTVRSQLAGQPVRELKPGEILFEPVGAVHLF
ncbi:MAG: cupin domain-containing protein, partial [Alphaproteobacteria bacterium]